MELLPWVFTSGWASGVNAYLVVLVLGLADRVLGLEAVPDALQRTDVLVVAAVLFLVDAVADKVPGIDTTWDAVHTVVRPVVGAGLALLVSGDATTLEQAVLTATGGGAALASHLVKAGLRVAVNTSPEPASNVVVSVGEDLAVAGVVALAVVQPVVAAGVAGILLFVGAFVVVSLWRRIRALRRRRQGVPVRG